MFSIQVTNYILNYIWCLSYLFLFLFLTPPPNGHCAGGTHPTGMHSCSYLSWLAATEILPRKVGHPAFFLFAPTSTVITISVITVHSDRHFRRLCADYLCISESGEAGNLHFYLWCSDQMRFQPSTPLHLTVSLLKCLVILGTFAANGHWNLRQFSEHFRLPVSDPGCSDGRLVPKTGQFLAYWKKTASTDILTLVCVELLGRLESIF